MSIDYIKLGKDYKQNPPICQCGAQTVYDEKYNKLVCTNPDCIKKSMDSLMIMFESLDNLAHTRGVQTNFRKLAYENTSSLVEYINNYGIRYGIELIVNGEDLGELGKLGEQLGKFIDTFEFEMKDLGKVTGDYWLSKFNIDFSKLSGLNTEAVVGINEQLGIDNTTFLATIIYNEYTTFKNFLIDLLNYIIIVKYPNQRRKVNTVIKRQTSTTVMQDALSKLNVNAIPIVSLPSNPSQEDTPDEAAQKEQELEELLQW